MRAAASALICAGLLALGAQVARAAVYTYTDENGVVHFTNVPNDDRFAKVAGFEPPQPPGTVCETPDVRYAAEIARLAEGHGVDSALVKAVVKAESNFDHRAISRKGALGLMQLMPETARTVNVENPFNPVENLDGGIRHLKRLLDTFGDTRLALAAYNAGENAVRRYNGIPPYPETRNYVATVLAHYGRYTGAPPPPAGVAPAPAAPPEQPIYSYVNAEGVKVFTNTPWRYQTSSQWQPERGP